MKLQIIDDLVAEVSLPMSEYEFTLDMKEFCLAGKVKTLADGRLHITVCQQKCTLDEAAMSAMFNEILYLFDYKLEFNASADFDPEFYLHIRRAV